MVFERFWSENWNWFWPFWSQRGHAFHSGLTLGILFLRNSFSASTLTNLYPSEMFTRMASSGHVLELWANFGGLKKSLGLCLRSETGNWFRAAPPHPRKKGRGVLALGVTWSANFLRLHFIPAEDNSVALTEFEASPSGMIKSFTTRFPGNDTVLEDLWRAEMPYHKLW